MKTLFKTVILSCAVWAAGTLLHSLPANASSSELSVKIQINDSIITDVTPFIDENGNTQVPIRPVAEQMGYQIEWSKVGAETQLVLQNDKRTIQVKSGSAAAEVNGKQVTMSSPALFKDGFVYVPVRFISESFGYMVQWDSHNDIAIICKDGKYHAPAWWKPAPAPASAAKPDPSEKLVETAQKYVGTPYAWGGTGPSGFDCSGFVDYVFRKQGIYLPRSSMEMYDDAGSSISPSDLKPGDLVFFRIDSSTSHAGIYLGKDSFISSTSSYGVHIDSLLSRYWEPKYIGARRVI